MYHSEPKVIVIPVGSYLELKGLKSKFTPIKICIIEKEHKHVVFSILSNTSEKNWTRPNSTSPKLLFAQDEWLFNNKIKFNDIENIIRNVFSYLEPRKPNPSEYSAIKQYIDSYQETKTILPYELYSLFIIHLIIELYLLGTYTEQHTTDYIRRSIKHIINSIKHNNEKEAIPILKQEISKNFLSLIDTHCPNPPAWLLTFVITALDFLTKKPFNIIEETPTALVKKLLKQKTLKEKKNDSLAITKNINSLLKKASITLNDLKQLFNTLATLHIYDTRDLNNTYVVPKMDVKDFTKTLTNTQNLIVYIKSLSEYLQNEEDLEWFWALLTLHINNYIKNHLGTISSISDLDLLYNYKIIETHPETKIDLKPEIFTEETISNIYQKYLQISHIIAKNTEEKQSYPHLLKSLAISLKIHADTWALFENFSRYKKVNIPRKILTYLATTYLNWFTSNLENLYKISNDNQNINKHISNFWQFLQKNLNLRHILAETFNYLDNNTTTQDIIIRLININKDKNIKKKIKLPVYFLLFYPDIKKREDYNKLIKATVTSFNLTYFFLLTAKRIKSPAEKDIVNSISPKNAIKLIKKKIVSDEIIKKASIYTFASEEDKVELILGTILNSMQIEMFNDIIQVVTGNRYSIEIGELLQKTINASKILTDKELEAFIELIRLFIPNNILFRWNLSKTDLSTYLKTYDQTIITMLKKVRNQQS